jgi:hypothetical protein
MFGGGKDLANRFACGRGLVSIFFDYPPAPLLPEGGGLYYFRQRVRLGPVGEPSINLLLVPCPSIGSQIEPGRKALFFDPPEKRWPITYNPQLFEVAKAQQLGNHFLIPLVNAEEPGMLFCLFRASGLC